MKAPSFQFYPGDWMRDPALRAVSLAARGLWIDMLCLMHESPRRGYLCFSDEEGMKFEHLARIFSVEKRTLKRLLDELETCRVFSRENGIIYSRRMVKDQHLTEIRREAGKAGGNPALLKQSAKQNPQGVLIQNEQQKPTPSSSSSSSYKTPLPPSADASGESVSDKPISKAAMARELERKQTEWFEAWWKTVWRKHAKEAARRSWLKLVRDEETFAAVTAGTEAQLPELLSREPQFRPMVATWLNQRRWEDELGATPQQATLRVELPEWRPAQTAAPRPPVSEHPTIEFPEF